MDESTAPAMDCVFCRIVTGELPSHQVYADEGVIGFLDLSPATPGHTLIVPRVHSTDLYDVAVEALTGCARAAQQIAIRLRDRLGADGVNVDNATGAAAWQSVFHFHLHVVPRYVGDTLQMPWRASAGDPTELSAMAARLR